MSTEILNEIVVNSRVLNKISSENVFCLNVFRQEKAVLIEECCDNFYDVSLSKNDLLELSDVFKKLADYIEEED